MASGKWKELSAEQKANRMAAHKKYMDSQDKVEMKITIDRNKRSQIQKFASDHNYPSTTDFVVKAIDEKMDRESGNE